MSKKYFYVFGLSLLLLVGFATSCRSEPAATTVKPTESKKEGAVAMYSRLFADLRQSSLQLLKTQAVGRQAWHAPFKDASVQTIPTLLLVDNSGLTVQYANHLQRLSFEGAFGWAKERDGGLDIFGFQNEIFYTGTDDFLHAVNIAGKERFDEFFIPRAYARGGLRLVVPLGEDHFLMQTFNRPEEVELGKPPEKDNYHLFIKGPESYKDIDWSVKYEGIALPGLITADGKKVVVLDQSDRIMVFDIATGKQLSSIEIKGAGFVRASLDQTDNIIAYCWDAEDRKKLCSYTLQGALNWEYPLGGRDTRVAAQPPALTTTGQALIIVDSLLLLVADGNKLWERPVPPAAVQYMTVLGDNSVLVTAANVLTHFGNEGQDQFLFRLPVDEVITTPPVIDDKGRIYLGTTKGIYCIN
jgi:hypothetical protein